MSSRALRKLQKEREQSKLEQELENASESEDEIPRASATKSAFAMLSQVEGEGEEQDDEGTEDEVVEEDVTHQDQPVASSPVAKPKKKKQKKKKKSRNSEAVSTSTDREQLDDIDQALKSLSTGGSAKLDSASVSNVPSPQVVEACKVLAIDTHHLQVANEMTRLFGKAALRIDRDEEPATPSRRQQDSGVTLAEAVAGRNSQGGPGLPAIIRRRNIFVQGKEEWPKAPGGGLGMEIVEKRAGGVIEYRFAHNKAYQSLQREFDTCVLSMDPTLMINLLRFNPYHISTLLQVSEIAKQERDHATSGDLLERALFSFGRAVHSSFAASLAEGKARLDFRRPENREFWLAAWRYIGNVGMRATWRTAYEWARLLLSLDPEQDPYEVKLVIDQFAIRAKQGQSFLDMIDTSLFKPFMETYPNLAYSAALARLGPKSKDESAKKAATQLLCMAIKKWPWVAARLFQQLGIDKLPPSIWGRTAESPGHMLRSELYVVQGADIWKTPEALDLLKSAAAATDRDASTSPPPDAPITLKEARHVVLTDKPPLISLLPQTLTAKMTSVSDPMPPPDNIQSYDSGVHDGRPDFRAAIHNTHPAGGVTHAELLETLRSSPAEFIADLRGLQELFDRIIPEGPTAIADSDEAADRVLARSGMTLQELHGSLNRYVVYREVLDSQPGQSVEDAETGQRAIITESGEVQFGNREEDD